MMFLHWTVWWLTIQSSVKHHILTQTAPPHLYSCIEYIYIYLAQMAPQVIDLWTIICECCIVLSAWLEFRPETVSDTVRSRPTSLYMITLVMIRVLPHGMDGCSPQNYYLSFFCFIFRFSDFSVAFVSRPGGSLCWISKISNQLIYFLSLGLFFLQSKIAYVVLLSIFRLRDGYMSWRQ